MPTKLLIADDSTTIQKVFERTFSTEEFTLSFANNGEEALSKARSDKPELIIADINMPEKNGFEVCEEVKKDPLLRGIPVLLLIGILDDFDEDESRRVGADGFIVKPFESNAAISKVREALVKRKTVSPLGETAKGPEEVLELRDIVEEPAATAPPPQKRAAEEIVELKEIVEEPLAPPPREKREEGFILQTPLRDFEVELKEKFSEREEKKERPLSLDLPLDEMGTEPTAKSAKGSGLFGDLGIGDEEREGRDERLEDILGRSATELEKIDGLISQEEEKGGMTEEEFEERFMETFETVFEPEEGERTTIGISEKGTEQLSGMTMEGLAERVATAIGHELRKSMEEVIKDKVPKLVRQEIERLKKG